MPSEFRFIQAKADLDRIKIKAEQLNREVRTLEKSGNLTKVDIINPYENLNTLQKTKAKVKQLISVLRGTMRSLAPRPWERGKPFVHGSYGRIKGEFLPLLSALEHLVKHLDTLMEVNQSANKGTAKLAQTLAESSSHSDDLAETGLQVYGDALVLVVAIASLIDQFFNKNRS